MEEEMSLKLNDKDNRTSTYLHNYIILSTLDINPHDFPSRTTQKASY